MTDWAEWRGGDKASSIRDLIPSDVGFKLVTRVAQIDLGERVGLDFADDREEVIERADRRQRWE
jgi:hypothetical protein